MTPRLLIDMNLTPDWVPYLGAHGIDAIHWDSVGRRDAPDAELMGWAVQSGRVVFPDQVGAVVAAVRQHRDELHAGTLLEPVMNSRWLRR